MKKIGIAAAAAGFLLVAGAGLLPASGAQAQNTPSGRKLTADELENLQHKHPGQLGVLAPANIAKPRPKPPFNLTGTWFIDLSDGFDKYKFGPPYPEFLPDAAKTFPEAAAAKERGENYRDSIGQCWPAGLPMIMTRVWPIDMIQLPTAIYMISGFMNSTRFIYLDGRKYSDENEVIPSYNGESIGKWEGDTLVGTIKEFQWTNPHTWIEIDVPATGTPGAAQWGIEGMSPNFLARRGWSRDTLKPGDKVNLTIHPLKDGSHGGSFVRVMLPDGTVMKQSGS